MTRAAKAKHIAILVVGVTTAVAGILAQGASAGLHLSTTWTIGAVAALVVAALSQLGAVLGTDPTATSEVRNFLSTLGAIASVAYGFANAMSGAFAPGSSAAIVVGILCCLTGDLRAFGSTSLPGKTALLLLGGSLLLSSPAQAQSPSQFGGCFDGGAICLGPSASIMLGEFNLSTSKFSGGVIPGVGYGLTYTPPSATWATMGLDLYAAFNVSQSAPNSFTPMLVGSFANYVRVGFGLPITETSGPANVQEVVTFGIGSNFGGSTAYVASQAAR